MSDRVIIGEAVCHLCSYPIVIKESKGGRAYYSCEGCQTQHFARGTKSDLLMRKYAKKVIEEVEIDEDDGGWFS